MKKKFNFKLTIMLVGLFIGLLLVIIGNKNIFCLGFGFIILGLDIIFYAYEKSKNLQTNIIEISNELSKVNSEDFMYIAELNKVKKQLSRQKNFSCFMFYLCGTLLILLGIMSMV